MHGQKNTYPQRLVAAAVSVILASSSTAFAQDLPTDGFDWFEPYDWNGPYLGAIAGHGSGSFGWNFPNTNLAPGIAGSQVGVVAGFNLQFDNFIIGIDGDYSRSTMSGEEICMPIVVNVACNNKVDWIGTARARIGTEFGPALIYATGGVAGAGITGKIKALGLGQERQVFKGTQWGWTAGGGADVRVWKNLIARGEVLYFDFANQDHTFTDFSGTATINVNMDGYVARAALIWKFDWDGDWFKSTR